MPEIMVTFLHLHAYKYQHHVQFQMIFTYYKCNTDPYRNWLFITGPYEHWCLLFVQHTIHVNGNDDGYAPLFCKWVVCLPENGETYQPNTEITANISSSLDVSLQTVCLLSVALCCVYFWNWMEWCCTVIVYCCMFSNVGFMLGLGLGCHANIRNGDTWTLGVPGCLHITVKLHGGNSSD